MDRLIRLMIKSPNCLKLYHLVPFKPTGTCTPIETQRHYDTSTVRKVSETRRDRGTR